MWLASDDTQSRYEIAVNEVLTDDNKFKTFNMKNFHFAITVLVFKRYM